MDQQFIHHHLNRLNSRIFILFVAGLLLGGLATLTATISFAQYGYRAGITLGSDRVQYVNPDGRNKISFAIYGQTGTVDFALHALSDAQFIEHFRQWNPYYVPDVSQLSQEVAWQETITSPNASYHDAYTTPLPDVPSGLYLLTARASQGQPDSALVVVSRLSLTMKRGPDERLMLWSTTFTTGAAVPEMEITLYDERGENKTIGHTGPDGIVKFPPAANAEQPWYLAIGRAGNEITAVGTHDDWREFGWYSSWYRKRYIVYLHTDRPLYRPGHTIYYNGFIRERVDGELVPINSATNIEVKLQDSRGNVVATEEVNADEYGAVNGEFALGNSPPLGRYHVVLTIDPGDTAFHQSQELKVEEYRKPEYEVKVTTDKPFGIAGDPVAINVDVDYFFGQPTADADVELKIYEQEYYYYDYWWEWEYYARPTNRKYVTTLKGKTDAEGHWETSFTPPGSLEHDKYYTFEALVTDALGQPVSGSASVRAHRHTFRLKVQTERYGFEVDDPVHVNVSTVTHDGQPTANRNVNVAIERRRYREPSRIIAEQQVTTDQSGKAQATFTNLPEGWYYIVATVRDDRGKFIETNRYLWIYDPNGRNWWYTSNNVLSIETDQDIYTPGDTAQLLIQSRISDTVALLTIERDTLLDEMIVPLDGPVTKVDLPITDAFAPNVYVTLQVYDRSRADNPDYTGEGELAYTRIMLHIPADHKRLNVDITPNAEKYGAGDQAEFTLKVTDRDGQPMAARLVLALVDEALLAIEADKSPVMRKTFYEETYFPELRTYGSPTRPYYAYYLAVPELPDLTPIPEALGTATPPPSTPTDDPSDESDNALTGRDDTNGSEPRRVFLDTAYWNPNITTGADGIAKVTVPLPDNLTTWRVIVKAITLDTKVGEATSNILVTQDIIARPGLPRFGVVGDRFPASLVSQNFTGQDLSAAVRMESDNLVLLDSADKSLDLPNGQAVATHWTAVAARVGTGLVTSSLNTPLGNDAVELPFKVKPFTVPNRVAAAGRAAPTAVETFDMPINAVTEASKLRLNLSATIAMGLLDDLDSLIDYPYGCVEQTMSRLLPSAVASKTYKDLNIPNPKADQLPDIMTQGLQKIYGFQQPSGGWGWWSDDDTSMYLTAYVLFGLLMVDQAGFDVDTNVLERGFNRLDKLFTSANDVSIQAYALYVKAVAERGNLTLAQQLAQNPDRFDPFGLSMLTLALHLDGDRDGAETLLAKLLTQVVETEKLAYWPAPENRDWYHWRTMSSTEKNTGAALRTLIALRPNDDLASKAVRWLLDQRQSHGYGGAGWRDTQATTFAILSLTDYIRVFQEQLADYKYSVLLNGNEIASGQVTPATVTQPIDPIEVSGDKLLVGDNEVRIEHTGGDTPLYYALLVQQELFFEGFTPVSSIDGGLAIERTYQLVEEGSVVQSASRSSAATNDANVYHVGDLVEVVLKVKAATDLAYVLISDPIPAGFEGLQENLNTVSFGEYWWDEPFMWHSWGYNYKDVRDDRVEFFITRLNAGEHTYRYRMRANLMGEYSVLPTWGTLMYEEDVYGRSASLKVTVLPEGGTALIPLPLLAGDFDSNCLVTELDARMAAAAWGTKSTTGDVSGASGTSDGIVDLYDVSAIATRRGVSCFADRSIPVATDGRARFAVIVPDQEQLIGTEFEVQVVLEEAGDLAGYGVTLNFPPHRLDVARVEWNSALGQTLPLGPYVDRAAGYMSFGGFDLPSTVKPGDVLATVVFRGNVVGDELITASSAQAAVRTGQIMAATAESRGGPVTIGGKQIFLPIKMRK